MECDYEYKISTTYLMPLLYSGSSPDLNDENIQKTVSNQINHSLQNRIKEELDISSPDKFEIRSHCITIQEGTIVLTLLFQRPYEQAISQDKTFP